MNINNFSHIANNGKNVLKLGYSLMTNPYTHTLCMIIFYLTDRTILNICTCSLGRETCHARTCVHTENTTTSLVGDFIRVVHILTLASLGKDNVWIENQNYLRVKIPLLIVNM